MSDGRAPKTYRRGRWHKVENSVMSAMARAGLIPNAFLLTTRGRKTALPRSNPVAIVEHDTKRWLVAPYGPVPWVLNARASGEVTLTRRADTRRFTVFEVPAEEAGPVLKQYVAIAPATRAYFAAERDAPVEVFAAEADKHPVFELTPIESSAKP